MATTLTYFDFDASRGLECRLALSVAGVAFTDRRIQRAEWPALKATLPFGALPVLDVDGKTLPQSSAILRFVGGSHGLHPSDPGRAAWHDAVMQSVEDFRHKIPMLRGAPEDEKKEKREAFAAGWMTQWAATLQDTICGPFIEGEQLMVADLKLYTILRALFTGVYDHIPGSTVDAFPKLRALYEAVDAEPRVQAYWASRAG